MVPFCAKDAVILFHDVLEFGLQPGFEAAARLFGAEGVILDATTSGMGVIALKPNAAVTSGPLQWKRNKPGTYLV